MIGLLPPEISLMLCACVRIKRSIEEKRTKRSHYLHRDPALAESAIRKLEKEKNAHKDSNLGPAD